MNRTQKLSATLRPVAVAALLGVAGFAAHAQSNVTLFGVLDAGVRYVDNGGQSITSLASSGNTTSRLGVRGTEDLGGGLKAGFWLEHGLNVDTGTQSDTRFWNRRSTVSLSGGFGEIRLGRDFSPTYLTLTQNDVFGDVGIAGVGKFQNVLGSNTDNNTRVDNQAQYFLPSLGGLYGNVGVAAGEGVTGKKQYAGRIGYGAGPFDVSFAYSETETAVLGGNDKYKTAIVGASYNLGVAKISSFYRESKFGDRKIALANIGVAVPVGNGTIKAAYLNIDASGNTAAGVNTGADDAQQVAVGYVYDLSKRTAVYTTAAWIKNKGNATYALPGGPTIGAGQTSKGIEAGLRHSF